MRIRRALLADQPFVVAAAERLGRFGPPAWRSPEEIVSGEVRTLRACFEAPPPGTALLIAESEEGSRLGFAYLEQLQDYFKSELAKFGKLIKAAGIKPAAGS